MASELRPKESKEVLEPTKGTLAVENGLLYDYYSISFGEQQGPFVSIKKLPPVFKEGFVTYQKKLYKVGFRDFLRSRVNVGQPAHVPAARNADNGNSAASAPPDVAATSGPGNQPRVDSVVELQVQQAADLAFEDQVRALLYAADPEEEWDYQTAPQS